MDLAFMVLSVRRPPCRSAGHHGVNDLIARAMASAGILVSKEPQGLSRSDGKRLGGLSLIPWQAGKTLAWDVTFMCSSPTRTLLQQPEKQVQW